MSDEKPEELTQHHQFGSHLFQNQTQQLGLFPNTSNSPPNTEWRNTLLPQERQGVLHQFRNACHSGFLTADENEVKLENLARGLEYHIYESAVDKPSYFARVAEQLGNIAKKTIEKRTTEINGSITAIPTMPLEMAMITKKSPKANSPILKVDEGTLAKSDENDNLLFGGSVIQGMKVTLLTLTDAEKASVQTKMDQLRPIFLGIDGLIQTLMTFGGNQEFDKIRKLSGMKQMLGAQFDVLLNDTYFIRPDTLVALIPSLNQYFHYGELLLRSNGGRIQGQPMQRAVGQRGVTNGQQQQQFNRQAPQLMKEGSMSPNMRPNNIQRQPQAQQQQQQPLSYAQQIGGVHQRLLTLQHAQHQTGLINPTALNRDQLEALNIRKQEIARLLTIHTAQFTHLSNLHQQSLQQAHQQSLGRGIASGQQQLSQQQLAQAQAQAQIQSQMQTQQRQQIQQQQQVGHVQQQQAKSRYSRNIPVQPRTPQQTQNIQNQQILMHLQQQQLMQQSTTAGLSAGYTAGLSNGLNSGITSGNPSNGISNGLLNGGLANGLTNGLSHGLSTGNTNIGLNGLNGTGLQAGLASGLDGLIPNGLLSNQPIDITSIPATRSPSIEQQTTSPLLKSNSISRQPTPQSYQQMMEFQNNNVLQSQMKQMNDSYSRFQFPVKAEIKDLKVEAEWDDLNAFTNDTLVIIPIEDTKEEDKIEDFFNWDYEPPQGEEALAGAEEPVPDVKREREEDSDSNENKRKKYI